jgi:hypothetical protein
MRILQTRVRRKRLVRPSGFGLRFFTITIRSFFAFLRPSRRMRPESSPQSQRVYLSFHPGFQHRRTFTLGPDPGPRSGHNASAGRGSQVGNAPTSMRTTTTIKLVAISLQTGVNLSRWELVRLCTNAHVKLRTEPEKWYATVEVLGLIPLISRGERCG